MEESKLFIGGLAAEATEDDVRALFSPHGFITEIAMLPTKSTTGQKCCFVKYGTKPAAESANEALQTLNGKFQMPGTDRPIAVRWADNGKGENPGKGERTSGPPSAPPMGMHAPMYGGYPLQQPVMHMVSHLFILDIVSHWVVPATRLSLQSQTEHVLQCLAP